MAVFPLLADPDAYAPCAWDLTADTAKRGYWLDLFRRHFPTLLAEAERSAAHYGLARPAVEAATERFFAWLEADAPRVPRLDVLTICRAREAVLDDLGFDDPYRLAKHEQNERCLAVLPALLGELDAITDDDERAATLMRGVFAGNIFDLGAPETIELFAAGDVDFNAVRARLKPRPWLVDDLDVWLDRLRGAPHRCGVLFVDNAGPDVLLGMLPFARELLRRGTGVILTANSKPSLNDVTHEELVGLVDRVAAHDAVVGEALRDGRLTLVPSGNDAPLIDLGDVSDALCDACDERGVDLVVLEGMGRSVESNHDAALTCDTLKVAMLKDVGVAEWLRGGPFDLVCRFDAAGGR